MIITTLSSYFFYVILNPLLLFTLIALINNNPSGGTNNHLSSDYGNRNLNKLLYYDVCLSLSYGKTSGGNIKANNPIFREYYDRKISECKTKHQAIICIM